MSKYYILVKEKNKLPALLLNEEEEYNLNENNKDRVVFWLNKKKAIKQLEIQKNKFSDVKYTLLQEVK